MGPYELQDVVGRGGMGTVYRGRHHQTGQVVAVKVMSEDAAADSLLLRRFEQEFWAVTHLNHPHIVRGLDFSLESGLPYLVMEFVDGQDLGRRVKREGPLAEAEALRITLQVADALQLAHHHKLIHRDVKPENILLDRAGLAKLADLGLVKHLEAEAGMTRSRTCMGTIHFMAPEQFEDAKRADARSDVYSLAATLYYALTGLVPFQGRGNLTILKKKLQNDFVPPRLVNPTLHEGVDAAICKALDASPGRRQRTCAEFAASLKEALRVCQQEAEENAAPVTGPLADAQLTAEERRAAPRFPSELAASCRPLQLGSGQEWQAEIQDASVTGILLHVDRRFETGTVLVVEILDEQMNSTSQWYVRVRWVREVETKKWGLGCSFSRELSEEELGALLGMKSTAVIVHADGGQPEEARPVGVA